MTKTNKIKISEIKIRRSTHHRNKVMEKTKKSLRRNNRRKSKQIKKYLKDV